MVNNHANILGFRLADLQIFGITLFRMKTVISQDDHSIFKRLDKRMKEGIVNIGSGALPITHQTFLVLHPTRWVLPESDPSSLDGL